MASDRALMEVSVKKWVSSCDRHSCIPAQQPFPSLPSYVTAHFPDRWCNWEVSFQSQKGETRGGGGVPLFCPWSLGCVELWRPLETLKSSLHTDKGGVKR